ncbi:MAG TPA: alpha-glucosidase [Stellaceae bacterium]|nr:alpha-glucosidase [Stellaceae bacterium]
MTLPADRPWWQGAVLYQIYPRSFFDTNGDGIGDLPGVIAKLDYIAGLGVDGIWLSPFFASPMRDFGYDVADYLAVDPTMGTLADVDALLVEAHRLGLKVLIDQVWAHTSDQHAWFEASRAGEAGHADWYVWADPKPDGTPPNNWLSVFGGSAWSWSPRRRKYYLHPFLESQPKLDLGNQTVLDAVLSTGAFWLDRGVDGFRLDAVDFLRHDPALRDNPAVPPPRGVIPAKPFGLQRHLYDVGDEATVLPVLGRIRALTDRYPGAMTLAEVSSQPGAYDRIAAYTGPGRLHLAYTLKLLREDLSPALFAEVLESAAAAIGADALCWAFSNHDVARAAGRWLPPGAEGQVGDFAVLLTALLLSLPGTACLYQGDELGLMDASLTHDRLRDPFGIAYWPEFKGRDGSRTPMPWCAEAPHAGFSSAPETWLPVAAEHRALAIDRQEADPGSVLHRVRRLIAWRREQPALRHGRLGRVRTEALVLAFERATPDDRLVAAFNMSPQPATFSFGVDEAIIPSPDNGFNAHGFTTGFRDGTVRLPGFGVFFGVIEPANTRS